MAFTTVYGQSHAVQLFESNLSTRSIHHAWLLNGPDGVGKERCAFEMAAALLCQVEPFVGCEACAACRRVRTRTHPDVTVLLPDAEAVERGWAARSDFVATPSWDIRIDQVRKLQERLSLRALESTFKVAVILSADAMNLPAQNALLKTLEEPSANTVLLLVSATPDRLLPTIRSRCVKAPFVPLSQANVARILTEILSAKSKPEEIEKRAALSFGSAGHALSLSEKVLTRHAEVATQFATLHEKDARAWLAWSEQWSEDRLTAELALDVVKIWLYDVTLAKVNATNLSGFHDAELVERQAEAFSMVRLQHMSRLADEAKNAIVSRNGSARLQLDRMVIEMFGA
jgi:DNA polymerase III subunit delta'